MTHEQAKGRIQKLRNEINHHRTAYHVHDEQTISDAALDSLKHELYKLEQQYPDLITTDSPTQRIGGKPLEKFKKVQHSSPMLSMEDVFSFEEFCAWYERIGKLLEKKSFAVFCMVKLDGLAIELVYRNGLLETASTRGDGKIGEDITQNVKTIEAVPLSIKEKKEVVVRGEIYFPSDAFDALNKKLKKAGENIFSNPRNAAAGSVRQLDPSITASRPLSFFAWDLLSDLGQKNHADEWEVLKELGFPTNHEAKVCLNEEDVKAFFKSLGAGRSKMNYWIDGMVIRVNDNQQFAELGVVGKTPRALVAWKFPAEETTAVIENVEWFVGRTGALTPVANILPTQLAGTTVKHASLHNLDEIERLDVRIGDTIILYKAGDIIPKVKEVLKNLRPQNAKKIKAPKLCPVCGSKVERIEGEVAIMCTNRKCFAQDRERILYAARAFGIDGLGPQTVALLLDNKVVQRPSDLFRLVVDDLLGLERFADLSSQKLIVEIQAHKNISFAKFLTALGIRHIGEETAKAIAVHFKTLERLVEAKAEEFISIEGIGEVVAKSLSMSLGDEHTRNLIDDYILAGVRVLDDEGKTHGKLSGKTFVFTGTLPALSREQAKSLARKNGGDVTETVSKNTDYVVAGEDPGSKYKKAQKLGVKILTEADFLRIV